MNKIFLIIAFLFFYIGKSFGQDKPRVYLSGINGYEVKISQLFDSSTKYVTDSNKATMGSTKVYFWGKGFSNVTSIRVFIGRRFVYPLLMGMKEKIIAGTKISIDDFYFTDEKTKKQIYFYGCTYTVIDD
jgi:hypothetical protein